MSPLSGLGPQAQNPYLTQQIARLGAAAEGTAPAGNDDKLTAAAEEFEAVYLSTVFDRMFASIETDGPFGGGEAEKTWRSFLTEQYASEVVRSGGIGLADAVRGELVGLQEATNR